MINTAKGITKGHIHVLFNDFMGDVGGKSYYVRPSGGDYGTEDGLSYETAWDGFTNIDWDLVKDQTLYICGEHAETLTIQQPCTIESYLDGGIIDVADSLDECIDINSVNNVIINDVVLKNAVVSCLNIRGTAIGIITNNLETTGSGNQGVQHLENCSATHNNIYSHDNFDDGVSGHEDATIVLNGGILSGNSQNINYIGTVDVICNNTTLINSTAQSIFHNGGGNSVYNNCIVEGEIVCDDGVDTRGNAEFNNCLFNGLFRVGNCEIVINKSRFTGESYIDTSGDGGNLTINYSTFKGISYAGTQRHFIDTRSGEILNLNYVIFDDIAATRYAVVVRAGAITNIRGCVFNSSAKDGNGVSIAADINIYNSIFTNLLLGVIRSAGATILENCCFYDNTTSKSGTITSNDEVTTDPKILADFSLDTGSSCIGTGEDLGETYNQGIESIDLTDDIPVIETKTQNTLWDIGAVIS